MPAMCRGSDHQSRGAVYADLPAARTPAMHYPLLSMAAGTVLALLVACAHQGMHVSTATSRPFPRGSAHGVQPWWAGPCRGYSSSVLLGSSLQPLAAAPRGWGYQRQVPSPILRFQPRTSDLASFGCSRDSELDRWATSSTHKALCLMLSPSRSTQRTAERGRGEKKRNNGFASTLPSRAVS